MKISHFKISPVSGLGREVLQLTPASLIVILKDSVNVQTKDGISHPSWKRKGSRLGWHGKGACGKKIVAYFLFQRTHPTTLGEGRGRRGDPCPAAAGPAEKGGDLGREKSQSAIAGFWGSSLNHRRLLHGDASVLQGSRATNVLLDIWRCGTLSAVVCQSVWVPYSSKSLRKDLVFTLWYFIC